MNAMVLVADALLVRCARHVDWIHMPLPKARTDPAYFAALRDLDLGDTELILGLVHHGDIDGTRERIATAGGFANEFSVTTECGLGRTPVHELQNIFEIAVSVCIS
jgi:hypothetical protein